MKACIGQETHEDGGFHLHVCAWYKAPLQFRGSRHLDIEWEGEWYHPNVKDKQIKSKKRALEYCSKQDPEPLQYNMDIKEETKARENHKRILGKRLLDGEPLHRLVQEEPSLLIGYANIKRDLAAYKRDVAEDKPDLPA